MPNCAKARYVVWGRLLAAAVLGLLAAVPARAIHEESPDVTKITSGTSHFVSSGRSYGPSVAFSSDQDLTGLGALRVPGRQIFHFNQFYYDCFHGLTKPVTPCPDPIPPPLLQVTNGPGNPDNPSIGTIDSSGNQWIAFDADGSFNGLTGDSGLRRQIFMKNLVTEEIRTVTFARNGDSVRPTVNSIALLVAFESTAPLAGFPNPTGVSQIFLYDRSNRVLKQLTFGMAASTNPNMSGVITAFQSTSDLTGTGADTGVSQIFYNIYDRPTHISVLKQLTYGNGPSIRPWVSEEGQEIAFESQATNIPGTLGGPGNQIYISSRVGEGAPEPVTIRQVTWPSRFGDCSYPVTRDGPNDLGRMAFICTGDPLDNGTTGNRAFVLDRQDATLYQITGVGDVAGPIHLNVGHWFMTLSTSSDLAATGSCNYQLYVVDYFEGFWDAATQIGQLPQDAAAPPLTSVIGTKTFEFIEGTVAGGSQIAVTTPGGSSLGFIEDPRIPESGELSMVIGAPDEFTREASMRVPQVRVKIPAVPMPPGSGIGAVCVAATGDGEGVIDCDGGRSGGDIAFFQDHDTSDTDPLCLGPSCREDAECQGPLPGPHQSICPVCIGADPTHMDDGTCMGGVYDGLPCTSDEACWAGAPCVNGDVPTCNGPLVSNVSGTFVPGGALMTLPVHLSFSLGPGIDGTYCNGDDQYSPLHDIPLELRLTTSTSAVTITDADAVLGSTLAVTETGAPFDCIRLRAGDMEGARLVGVLPLLDIPNVPVLHDVVVSVRLEAQPPDADLCGAPCSASADCDDGNACNGVETCVLGQCAVGTAVVCDDGDPCNGTESCDAGTGTCVTVPCDDGDPCNGTETCDLVNGCQPGTPVVCTDDGDVCNGVPSCDPGTGGCVNGPAPVCDDLNPCTDDGCDPIGGCAFTPNSDPCDDTDACTTADVCQGGGCVGTPVVCTDDGDVCNGVPTCDPGTGLCAAGPPLDCDDGNVCTDDTCAPVGGCNSAPNTLPCDDGDACTTGDGCAAGTCGGTSISCDDGVFCTGVETCDPETGCVAGTFPCDDGNVCTDDTCDPLLGCLTAPNAGPCDDGDACTSSDVCAFGACSGVPVVCVDANPCDGIDACDPGTGTCVPGAPPNCDDGNVCTDDACDVVFGCMNFPNVLPCDDGSACTSLDTCALGSCTGVPTVVCDDLEVCNGTESCDPGTGTCQSGTPPSCDDGDECTLDSCVAGFGCQNVPDPLCLLTLLVDDTRTASGTQVRGIARRVQLRKLTKSARKEYLLGLKGDRLHARERFRNADRRIVKFRGAVEAGAARQKVDGAVADRWMERADTVHEFLVPLIGPSS